MKFLRLILIGSLTLSAAAPCYGADAQRPTFSWLGKALIAAGTLVGVGALWALYTFKKNDSAHKKMMAFMDMLKSPANPESDKEELLKILNDYADLFTDTQTFLLLAIQYKKAYLAPLLIQRGAYKNPKYALHGRDFIYRLLQQIFESNNPELIKVLINENIISEKTFAHFAHDILCKHQYVFSQDTPDKPVRFIVAAMPENINKEYILPDPKARDYVYPQTLLMHVVGHMTSFWSSRDIELENLCDFLLKNGADATQANAQGETIFSLLSHREYGNTDNRTKKTREHILNNKIIPPMRARAEAISAETDLPLALVNLCSEYESGYDANDDRLLKLIALNHDENSILEKLSHLLPADLPAINKEVVNKADANGVTPLMFAAQKGHLKVVEELIDHGAHVELYDKAHMNALMYAAEEGHAHIVRHIVEHAKKEGLDIPGMINAQNVDFTFSKARLGNIMRYYVDGKRPGSLQEYDDRQLETSGGHSSYHGRYVFDRHGNLQLRQTGATPLILAIQSESGARKLEIVDVLLRAGADKTIANTDIVGGRTPLGHAQEEVDQKIKDALITLLHDEAQA